MKDEFFIRVSVDKEIRAAHIEILIETCIGATTWYEEVTLTGIDPEHFDYTTIEDAKRVLKNDTGPYQYYWVARDRVLRREAEEY
jgi:hypothetical protein